MTEPLTRPRPFDAPNHLYRSAHDRVIAGVAGGVAEHFDVDPSFVRIAWAILIPITGFLALFVYLVMALVVPLEKEDWSIAGYPTWAPPSPGADSPPLPGAEPPPWNGVGSTDASAPPPSWAPMSRAEWRAHRRATRTPGIGGIALGAMLVLAGAWLLLQQYFTWLSADRLWPLFVIGLGVVFLVAAFNRRSDVSA